MDFLEFIKELPLAGSNLQKRVVFYSLDTLYGKPFVYFTGIQRGETLDAFPTFETKEDILIKGMVLKGIHPFKGYDYYFYEIPVVHDLERPTMQCKITPYEILSIRHVDGVPIDPSSIFFLKSHSYLCIIRVNEEEIKLPASFYVAIPKVRVKEQLFLPSITEGIFKKGYYLYTRERCLEPIDHMLTVPNTIDVKNKEATLRKGHLFIETHDMGPVSVPPHTTFKIIHVTPEWITLKSSKPLSKPDEWCILRYFCNMENHWIGSRSKDGYDSVSYDQTFKTLNPDRVRCVSIGINT
jgi:hypothetical protein